MNKVINEVIFIQNTILSLEKKTIIDTFNELNNNLNLSNELIIDLITYEISLLPKIRPFIIEKIINFCKYFINLNINKYFNHSLLLNSMILSPIIIRKLLELNIYNYSDVLNLPLETYGIYTSLLFYPYYNKFGNRLIDKEFLELLNINSNIINDFINFGWVKNSIGYIIKFDDIENFQKLNFDFTQKIKWSYFEWSFQPYSLNFLSFSAHFGSIKIFKYLVLNNVEITDEDIISSISSNNIDIFSVLKSKFIFSEDLLAQACKYRHSDLFYWIYNNISNKNELFYYIYQFDINLSKFGFDNGISINFTDEFFNSHLHHATYNGNLSLVVYLVESGISIDQLNYQLSSPLNISISSNFYTICKYLIFKHAKINYLQNEIRHSPFFIAAEKNFLLIQKLLIKNGANINIKNSLGEHILIRCVEKGNLNTVEFLLNNNIDINIINEQGDTSLHKAVFFGNFEMVKFLLFKNADPNIKNNSGLTPISFLPSLDILKLLVLNNSNIQFIDNNGNNLLILYCLHSNFECFNYLKNKFDLNYKNFKDQTVYDIIKLKNLNWE